MGRADVVIPSHCPTSAAHLSALPRELLSAPLDYFDAEHARQRCICAYVSRMASDEQAPQPDAEAIAAFMAGDLRLHHEDEEQDLFPALRRRTLVEDGLEPILSQLTSDHGVIDPLANAIVASIKRQRGKINVPINKACAKTMMKFAETMLKHVSIENSIVLVIARKRLTPADLKSISRGMTARRGAPADV
jgi:hemerythrin-like domain-containing protein